MVVLRWGGGQRVPVHVLWQVSQTVVAQVQEEQAAHPQGTDRDRYKPVLRDVQVNQLPQATQLMVTVKVSILTVFKGLSDGGIRSDISFTTAREATSGREDTSRSVSPRMAARTGDSQLAPASASLYSPPALEELCTDGCSSHLVPSTPPVYLWMEGWRLVVRLLEKNPAETQR